MSDVYEKLEQFDYEQPNCTTDHIKTCIGNRNKYYWIYIGEVKEGTKDTKHGIGIRVWSGGSIDEGYWKDGKLDGRGRRIFDNGTYYIGQWKEGIRDGKGTIYYPDGDRYEGGWKNNDKYGQGTYYRDGDMYIGEWDEDGGGTGVIIYKD